MIAGKYAPSRQRVRGKQTGLCSLEPLESSKVLEKVEKKEESGPQWGGFGFLDGAG